MQIQHNRQHTNAHHTTIQLGRDYKANYGQQKKAPASHSTSHNINTKQQLRVGGWMVNSTGGPVKVMRRYICEMWSWRFNDSHPPAVSSTVHRRTGRQWPTSTASSSSSTHYYWALHSPAECHDATTKSAHVLVVFRMVDSARTHRF